MNKKKLLRDLSCSISPISNVWEQVLFLYSQRAFLPINASVSISILEPISLKRTVSTPWKSDLRLGQSTASPQGKQHCGSQVSIYLFFLFTHLFIYITDSFILSSCLFHMIVYSKLKPGRVWSREAFSWWVMFPCEGYEAGTSVCSASWCLLKWCFIFFFCPFLPF